MQTAVADVLSLPASIVSVLAIPIKPKDSVIPFLSSPPLPRPVLESKDVFLKSSLLPQLLLGILLPRSGPLPVWKCPVCGYENFSKFGNKSAAIFAVTGMLTLKSPSIFMPLVMLRLFRKLLILFPLTSGPGLALYAIKVSLPFPLIAYTSHQKAYQGPSSQRNPSVP